jgi:peptidoglycan/xylan/chitin deacetylase (PgdA/CDA1 family)
MVIRSLMRSAAFAALLGWAALAGADAPRTSEVAVTFDDLPARPAIARRLLRTIVRSHVPAIGFVNENKLATKDHVDVLKRWHAAGLALGNHTYSHRDLHVIGAEEFTRDVVRGEEVTATILGHRPTWFRHPFLHTGTTAAMKKEVEDFLASRGYRIAPVTLDNSEWIFARAYDVARDAATRKRIGEAYVVYMDQKLAYFEEQSHQLFGRNIRQVLLVHANALNADWFDDLAASMRRRGYRFVTLERALEDPAYRSADTYTGPAGITWIHRWALTAGKKGAFFAGEPATPQWIQDVAGIRE